MGKISANHFLGLLEKKRRWYLLARRTEAVMFKESAHGKFKFIHRLLCPEARLKESELESDRAGRGIASARAGLVKHTLGDDDLHHELNAVNFAKEIADYLTEAVNKQHFDQLIIVAEPHFLGLLRKAFPRKMKDLQKFELPKELLEGSDVEKCHLAEVELEL